MNITAIIPARGGSKGLHNKNLIPLLGIPLLAHTIRHARESKYIERVYVSSDDVEIRQSARRRGAYVIKRPEHLSGDSATSESALLHAVGSLAFHDVWPTLLVFLQCTSPIRRKDDIDNAIEQLLRERVDSLFSATETKQYVRDDGHGGKHYDKPNIPRTLRKPALLENGSIYVFKPWVLTEGGRRLGGKVTHCPQPWWCGLEIDTQEDLDLCASIMRLKRSELA